MEQSDEAGPGVELVTDSAGSGELQDVQQRLHECEELYRYVIELHGLIPWTADAAGRIVGVGRRWLELTGADPVTGLGAGWLDFVHPDDRDNVGEEWSEAVRSRDRLQITYRVLTGDGGYRWCEAKTRKRLDEGTQAAVWYGTLEDVHERQLIAETNERIQGELIHVSRLNAIGAMASVIAHDLNQPLTAAVSYLRGSKTLLSIGEAPVAEIVTALDEADRAIVRASDIVRRMRGFIARGEIERRTENLTELLEEACEFALADTARRGISYRSHFDANCFVLVDRVQVQQVVVNLLRNAVDAVSGRQRRRVEIRSARVGDDLCEVSISDTGPGIAAEAVPKLFDPFYTTRRDGMGLGLAISRMIVEAHGGSIRAEARREGGTIMRFTLPTSAGPIP